MCKFFLFKKTGLKYANANQNLIMLNVSLEINFRINGQIFRRASHQLGCFKKVNMGKHVRREGKMEKLMCTLHYVFENQ